MPDVLFRRRGLSRGAAVHQDQDQPEEISVSTNGGRPLTHFLFRYPAKFHAPVVAELTRRFTTPGQRVLDPFVGSGTALVELAVADRVGVGVDVDPVAVAVATAKTRRYDLRDVNAAISTLLDAI